MQLGPRKSVQRLTNRMRDAWSAQYWRWKAKYNTAGCTWDDIKMSRAHTPPLSYLNQLLTISDQELIKRADAFVNKTFDLLGSGPVTFDEIKWHIDFRLQKTNPDAEYTFDATAYYKDIHVASGVTEELIKDIKVPWELSRFQHLYILGRAYEATNDRKYVDAFIEQVTHWLEHNPFLRGPNWVCPMEVGIRAANWVIALEYFKSAQLPAAFLQRMICSLFDHATYLENNWEIYDGITSNHYLSDLIGYLYLCYFFKDMNGFEHKANWCFAELLRECDKQIFDEGTDYEASTTYHVLVTEMFVHAHELAQHMGFIIPDAFGAKLARMRAFISWCMISDTDIIKIGDNDSGIFVCGLQQEPSGQGIKHFRQVGLSIARQNSWHVSLRHHAFDPVQPTSHLHNDAGSITVALNGISIIVDPGTYVYTPSGVERNRARSVQYHNTFFIKGHEPTPFDTRLFALDVPVANVDPAWCTGDELFTEHNLYARFGLSAQRRVVVAQNKLVITDQWLGSGDLTSCWNFTLAPGVHARIDGGSVILEHAELPALRLTSEHLCFTVHDSWMAPAYGVKKAVQCVRMQCVMASNKAEKNICIVNAVN